MSLSLAVQCVSNPRQRLWVVTVLVLVVLAWPMWAKVVGAYADAAGFFALFLAASGTATKYGSGSN
jgi:hypothetical protein